MNSLKNRLSEYILADGLDLSMNMEKSQGCRILDDISGSYFLDMFSMFGSMAVGYNHPYLVKNKEWLGNLAVNKPTLSDVYNEHYAAFIETFSQHCMNKDLNKAFFVSGGALAVENALKAAFDWKVRKNLEKGIEKKGHQIIHFKQAFHGRSGYTLSLTNTADPRKTMYFPKFDWPRIDNPKLHFPLTASSVSETIIAEEKALAQIKTAFQRNENDIAAIIIEVIQAEGGDNHFRSEFISSLRKTCDENEALLIFDEVQTGIGLTGKMWAYEHFGTVPDLLSFGKKTQVCGILRGKRLDEVEQNVFRESSRINSTFGGNFVDMMRFKLILDIIQNEKLIENAATMGIYLLEQVEVLCRTFSLLTNPRGKGLMVAFDLETTEQRNALKKLAFDHRLLILGCGPRSIRFRPHLIINKQEIDDALSILADCMKQLSA